MQTKVKIMPTTLM